MIYAIENNSSSSIYYLDKYFFMIAFYAKTKSIEITNKELLSLFEIVNKSELKNCDICDSNDFPFIKFKDMKRLQKCSHGFVSNVYHQLINVTYVDHH